MIAGGKVTIGKTVGVYSFQAAGQTVNKSRLTIIYY